MTTRAKFHRALIFLVSAAISASVLTLVAVNGAIASGTGAIVNYPGCLDHRIGRNDDESSNRVSLPFTVKFYNRTYTSLFVNNNGNVTFDAPQETYTPFQITADTPPIIAPFFADVDTRAPTSGVVTYGVTSFDGKQAFCVNWRHVGYYSSKSDKRNDFQLLLVRSNSLGDFDIVFNYNAVRWETGRASGGSAGLGGTSAGAGYSNGDGQPSHFTQLPESLTNGAFLDGGPDSLATGSNTSPAVPGRWIFHIASGTTVAAADTCKKYYFVSVRGSGETSSGVEDRNASPYLRSAFDGLTTKYEAIDGNMSNVAFYQLPYQAVATSVLTERMDWTSPDQSLDRLFSTNIPHFLASVNEGVDQLTAYVASVEAHCALQHVTPRFILFGYSQGALVIHEYLNKLNSSWPEWNHIGYVGLIADPGRVENANPRFKWGTAPTSSYGICRTVIAKAGLADQCTGGGSLLPTHFAAITDEFCNANDIVCSTSEPVSYTLAVDLAFGIPGIQSLWNHAKEVHTNSYRSADGINPSILGKAAVGIAGMR